MPIRIPPAPVGPSEIPSIDGVSPGGAERAEALRPSAEAQASTAADPVTRIAEDVAAGRISRDEAVERIVAEALDSDIIRAAPSELRAEIAQALEALVATDPHLQSLVRNLGTAPSSGDGG